MYFRFMICHLHRIGIDNEKAYDDIAELSRKAPQFRFDWWIRSRTAVDIQRRCNTLVGLIEREVLGDEEKNKKRGPRLLPASAPAKTTVTPQTSTRKSSAAAAVTPAKTPSTPVSGIQKKNKDVKVTGTLTLSATKVATRSSRRK